MRSILVATCLLLAATSVAADVTRKSPMATAGAANLEDCERAGSRSKPALLVRHGQPKPAHLAACGSEPKKGKGPLLQGASFAIGVYR